MCDSDHQEKKGEEVSSISDDDDGVGLGLAVSSESQDTNPGGAGKRKVLHHEDR